MIIPYVRVNTLMILSDYSLYPALYATVLQKWKILLYISMKSLLDKLMSRKTYPLI